MPMEVDAVQWLGVNWDAIAEFAGLPDAEATEIARQMAAADNRARIPAVGVHLCLDPGDWLVRSADGQLFRVRQDAFEITYDQAETEISRAAD